MNKLQQKESRTKEEFIGQYLDKKMKNHNLPMGMAYYNKLSKHTDDAEKKWEKLIFNLLNK